MVIEQIAVGLVLGSLGWIGRGIWDKHGSKVAERFPIVEKLGLAEKPPRVVHRQPSAGVSMTEIRSRDDD